MTTNRHWPSGSRAGQSGAVVDEARCARCGRPVVRNKDSYETFEQMHWLCFHYEFEHFNGEGDPDEACGDPSCPARAFDPDPPPSWRSAT